MEGLISGLDMAQAMASVPADLDREFTRRLFMTAEIAFVAAHLNSRGSDGR